MVVSERSTARRSGSPTTPSASTRSRSTRRTTGSRSGRRPPAGRSAPADGFTFHIKAFGMMTRHPVKLEQLPPDLREGAETDGRGRVDHPSRELRAEVFRRFVEELEPLRAAGKLGGILFQLPPYIVPRRLVVRVPGVGGGAARGAAAARRVPPPQLVRGRADGRDAALPRGAGHVLRGRRLAAGGVERGRADGGRAHGADRVRALPRAQRRDVAQAGRRRSRALRLPVLAGGAAGVGRAAAGAGRRSRVRIRVLQQQQPQPRPSG